MYIQTHKREFQALTYTGPQKIVKNITTYREIARTKLKAGTILDYLTVISLLW